MSNRFQRLLGSSTQARLVAEPRKLDERQQRRLAAWAGIPRPAIERAGQEGLPLPFTPPTDAIAMRAEADKLGKLDLPVSAETDEAPFGRLTLLALKIGLLGALLNVTEVLLAEGLEHILTDLTGDVFLYAVALPAVFGALLALVLLPSALILGALGQLRRRERLRTLDAGARLQADLGYPTLTGRAAILQSRALTLQRQVIGADLPDLVEADLLSALSACIAGLPALSEMLEQVSSGLASEEAPLLRASEQRLENALSMMSEHLAEVETSLTACAVQSFEGDEDRSSIGQVRRATAAFQTTLQND